LHFFRPLELLQTRVQTVLCEQLIVRAALDDAALVEHEEMTLAFLIVAIRCEITNVVLPERRRSQCQVRHGRAKRKVPSIVFGTFSGQKRARSRGNAGIPGNVVCVTYRI
jgi:hypothetical protein